MNGFSPAKELQGKAGLPPGISSPELHAGASISPP